MSFSPDKMNAKIHYDIILEMPVVKQLAEVNEKLSKKCRSLKDKNKMLKQRNKVLVQLMYDMLDRKYNPEHFDKDGESEILSSLPPQPPFLSKLKK